MKKEIVAGLVIVLISVVTGYFGLGLHQTSETQDNLNDFSDSTNLQSCKDMRKSVCLTSDQIAESDYPESCFKNGENILQNPYQCPS
jgi:hypothetical protein